MFKYPTWLVTEFYHIFKTVYIIIEQQKNLETPMYFPNKWCFWTFVYSEQYKGYVLIQIITAFQLWRDETAWQIEG